MDIKHLLRDCQWPSASAAGKELHRRLGGPQALKSSSLGTYIGDLTKGQKPERWLTADMRQAAEHLADMLDVGLFDLFPELAGANRASPFAVPFWPTLRPLDPKHEQPVDAGLMTAHAPWRAVGERDVQQGLIDFMMNDRTRGLFDVLSGHRWLVVPPGGGKRFALEIMRSRGNAAAELRHLKDVALHRDTKWPVFVSVEEEDPATDGVWVSRLSEKLSPQVTVLATFERPLPPPEADRGEAGQMFARLGAPAWVDARWRPDRQSRAALVRWAANRTIGESLLEGAADQVIAWLDEVDPTAVHMGTPESILWVCACVSDRGLPTIRRRDVPELIGPWFDKLADRMAATSPDTARWLREHASRALTSALEQRAWRLDCAGWSDAPAALWPSLFPATEPQRDAIEGRLLRIAHETEPAARVEASKQIAAELATPSAGAVVSYLRHAGTLAAVGDGRLRLGPAWYVGAWTARWLSGQVYSESLAWGRLCFDPVRREAVDRVLDVVVADPAALGAVLKRVPAHPRGATEIGAVEALFAAIGRALLAGTRPAVDAGALHPLWKAQVACMIRKHAVPADPTPVSRNRLADQRRDREDWYANCWAWSFELARPSSDIPVGQEWLFPGWSAPPIDTMTVDLDIDELQEVRGRAIFRYLVGLCSDQPDAIPANRSQSSLWTAWAWVRLSKRQPVEAAAGMTVDWELLAQLVGGADFALDHGRLDLALALMKGHVAAHAARDFLYELMRKDRPAMRHLVDECIDGELAVELLARAGADPSSAIEWAVASLPKRTHLQVVTWALEKDPDAWRRGSWHDDATLAGMATDALGFAAVRLAEAWTPLMRSWSARDPEAALEWLLRTRWRSSAAWEAIAQMSSEHQVRLLEWVEGQVPGDRPDTVGWWAAWLLDRRPDLVDRLLPLLLFCSDPRAAEPE